MLVQFWKLEPIPVHQLPPQIEFSPVYNPSPDPATDLDESNYFRVVNAYLSTNGEFILIRFICGASHIWQREGRGWTKTIYSEKDFCHYWESKRKVQEVEA